MASDTFEVPIQTPDAWHFEDVEATTSLPHWTRDETALRALFSPAERKRLERRRALAGPEAAPRTVVFLSYENRWGRSGGIAAVASMLPEELARAGEHVIRLSPMHTALRTAPDRAVLEPITGFSIAFDGSPVWVSVFRISDNDRQWYLFEAPGFFDADGGAGGSDPYVHGDETHIERDGDDSKLLRDSIFAARVIPSVLAALAARKAVAKNIVVHTQDWELAPVALSVKEALLDERLHGISASVVLTLHNPYDHYLSDRALARITDRHEPRCWPLVNDTNRTVLAHMIPLADAAISTVSRRFAQELTTDPLQTGHFARHFQSILVGQGIVGIDNGAFMALPNDPALERAVEMTRRGQADPILERKQAARAHGLRRFGEYLASLAARPNPDEPVIGGLDGGGGRRLWDLPNGMPVFLMTGRLDPGQKGFDVMAGAIELLPKGLGRYIISPLSPLASDPDIALQLHFMRSVAERRPGEIVILPFRLTDIYLDLLAGVTWSVWPSLYEPFGGVTEPYLWQTPVVARATGGLVQQVADVRTNPVEATGILYRETVPASRAWQETQQRAMQHAIDPSQRATTALFAAQAVALAGALAQAAELYRDRRPEYGRLLANLPGMCRRLDWRRPVRDYRLWYDSASRSTTAPDRVPATDRG
jgi:glycogen synthase